MDNMDGKGLDKNSKKKINKIRIDLRMNPDLLRRLDDFCDEKPLDFQQVREIQILCESCGEFMNPEDVLSFIREREVQLPFVSSMLKSLSVEVSSPVPNARLILYKVKNNTQTVAVKVLLYKLPLIRESRATANLYLWILPMKNSLEVMWLVK